MNIRESIEYFHLSFCRRLTSRTDPALLALKGGCNLRFFYRSFRYSEDIDFDVKTISVDTLKKNVERVLDDGIFRTLLGHRGIEIVSWSAVKQTATTQRWKVGFRLQSNAVVVPTKIEFSRRGADLSGTSVECVDPTLIAAYQLQPVLLRHYQLPEAIGQKIQALIHRTETQARDVIDLKVLKDLLGSPVPISGEDRRRALHALESISLDGFQAQVWPYLTEDFQEFYRSKEKWREMRDEVRSFLEKLPERR